ncbi:MAG: flagellar biosynthetic protein FliR [Bacteroides sp.]|nr:flagellar biosynthetic protein FliR [Bacteroides sp.]
MNAIWDLIVNNFVAYLMVTARISGIFTFNPIFSRQNVPMRIKVGATLVISMTAAAYLGGDGMQYGFNGVPGFVMTLLKELAIGLVLGFITNLILTVIIYAGELMDNQIGFGMAKAMDPMTGIQMPLFANLFNYMFILYFFLIGGHLKYIELFVTSYDILPLNYGFDIDSLNLTYFIANYLGTVFILAVKFAMPIIASELITEFVIGVMMKAVPTIQIFVVNIQLKIVVGMLVLLAVASPMSEFLEYLLDILFTNLTNALGLIGT